MTDNNKGETKELTRLHTGATFGEMAFVSEAKRTAGVEAVDE
jgi:CRP-like cAMP-binding protein